MIAKKANVDVNSKKKKKTMTLNIGNKSPNRTKTRTNKVRATLPNMRLDTQPYRWPDTRRDTLP